ncbi:hypothetical protein DRQ36_05945 [bacterium]|nr:MAG: hypothetical protein DRQ36_05945 [bacterium]
MKNRLLKNAPAKLFALIAACVLWLHVATEQTYEHTFWYPIILEGLPDEYVLGAPLPDSVGVILKGRGKDLFKLLFAEGALVIDARGFKYSERFFELHQAELRTTETDCEVVEFVGDDRVRLVIDRYADREVPVKGDLWLEPAEGYMASADKVQFDPPGVIISGPESRISLIEYAYTEPETLRNLNITTTKVFDIKKNDDLFSYTPDKVSGTIFVEPLQQVEFSDIAVQVKGGKLRKGEKLQPETIDLVFTGTAEAVEALERGEISVFVDYIDVQTQGNQLRPVVVHPPGVSVVSMKPEYFTFESE